MRNQNQIKVEITKEMKEMINFLLEIFQTVGMYLSLKVFFLNLEKYNMLILLIMEISQDIGHRPIIFIRFNPDDYTDQSGTKVKSCFAADKSGIYKVAKSKVGDWNMRTNAILQQIAYWSETPTTKTVEVVQLFYDVNI